MCELCQRDRCPSRCPNYLPPKGLRTARKRAPFCRLCGERIEEGAFFYQRNGFPYCEACMDVIDTDQLVRICELSRQEWLEKMGFLYQKQEG